MVIPLVKKEKHLGITIQELLIVVMIISILATLAIWYLRSQVHKANDGKRKGDIRRVQIALEEYEKDNDCYPVSLPACDPGDDFAPYLAKVPCDPVTGTGYFYEPDPSSACPNGTECIQRSTLREILILPRWVVRMVAVPVLLLITMHQVQMLQTLRKESQNEVF